MTTPTASGLCPTCGADLTNSANLYKDGRCLTCKRQRDKDNYARRKGLPATAASPLTAAPALPKARAIDGGAILGEHGCGAHDPLDVWVCTNHRDGMHIADRPESDSPGEREVLATWPIAGSAADHSGAAALINMTRPASAQCSVCGSLGLTENPASILGAADAHAAKNAGHAVTVEGYEAGSTTARRTFAIGDLSAAATAGERKAPAAVKPRAVPEPPKETTVTLASGATYRMRQIAGLPDVEALKKLREAKLPVLLYGPPGTGKTVMVGAAFPDHARLDGDGDTIVDDFVGGWQQATGDAQRYVWTDGPLTTAMRKGVPLFIDDATIISPKVIAIVYPLMDGRGDLYLKAHQVPGENGVMGPERVAAQDGFYVIAGHNPGVHGAVMSEALASRFSVHIGVPTDLQLARRMGVDQAAIKVATNLSARMKEGKVGWAPQLRELLAFQRISDVLGREAALANMAGLAPEEDRPEVAEVINTVAGHEVTPLVMGAVL
jgi:nitric oxide reductase NorQ protein